MRLNPDKIRAHGELGVLLTNAGRYDEALPHLTRALSVLPDEEEFQRGLDQARAAVGAH